jgi:hypothetical protein
MRQRRIGRERLERFFQRATVGEQGPLHERAGQHHGLVPHGIPGHENESRRLLEGVLPRLELSQHGRSSEPRISDEHQGLLHLRLCDRAGRARE